MTAKSYGRLGLTRLRLMQSKALGHPHEVGQRPGVHLLHCMATMDLDRNLAEAELGGRLLVHKPCSDERHHLALACGEQFVGGAQRRRAVLCLACLAVTLERG